VVADAKHTGEILVKWQGLTYDECTWEPASDAVDLAKVGRCKFKPMMKTPGFSSWNKM